jgi:hypothetical protein
MSRSFSLGSDIIHRDQWPFDSGVCIRLVLNRGLIL